MARQHHLLLQRDLHVADQRRHLRRGAPDPLGELTRSRWLRIAAQRAQPLLHRSIIDGGGEFGIQPVQDGVRRPLRREETCPRREESPFRPLSGIVGT